MLGHFFIFFSLDSDRGKERIGFTYDSFVRFIFLPMNNSPIGNLAPIINSGDRFLLFLIIVKNG